MPPNAVLSDLLIQEAEKIGLSREDAEREFPRFKDYWLAQPGRKGVKADWPATWRNWIRKSIELRQQWPNGRKRQYALSGAGGYQESVLGRPVLQPRCQCFAIGDLGHAHSRPAR